MQDTKKSPNFGNKYWPGLMLVAIGIATYANSLNGTFIFDDYEWINDNPNIRSIWPLYQLLDAPAETPLEARPLVTLYCARPWGFSNRNIQTTSSF